MYFTISNYISSDITLKILDISISRTCTVLKHVGVSGWATGESRIPLKSVRVKDSANFYQSILPDTLIIKIASKDTKSFYFSFHDEVIKRECTGVDLFDCITRLQIEYIDPCTGELETLTKEFDNRRPRR